MTAILGAAFSADAATATWDRNSETTVTGYRLSYGTQSGSHPTTIDVGNVITYQFFPPVGQRYFVVVQAYDGNGGLSAKSTEVIVDLTATNQAPTLTQPANQTSTRNTAVSLALIASDPEGTAVTFSATGLPAGLNLNSSTGVIAGTLTTVGSYSVIATASDGALFASRAFAWSVTAQNQAPVLTQPANQTSTQNTAASLALVASDPDGTPVTFTATGLPSGLNLNSSTGVIGGTVTTVGTYNVIATASDGVLFASRAFAWSVTAQNQPPVLTQPANQTSTQNTAVSLTLSASDPNGSVVTFTATGLPSGLNVNPSTGVVAGTVTTVGTYNVMATASDGSLSASRTFTWTVTAQNQAPVLTQPANQTSTQNTAASLALVASDPNGTPVTFAATGLPPGLTVNPSTGVIGGTVTTVGTYNAIATASDGVLFASRAFAWSVTAQNQAPVLTQPANQTSTQNTAVSLTLSASDPNGSVVTFSATALPPGLNLNTSTGVIAGTVTTVGTYNVTATASDGSLSASRAFTWTVSALNAAPTLTQPVNQASTRNAAVSLALVASDPNGGAVTFSTIGLPPGLNLNATTGVIAGTVTTAGIYNVTATASDGALTASRAFTWTVDNAGSMSLMLAPVDTFININGTNSSSDPLLNTYTYPANRVANTILMKFDMSQIPANATISSAVLQLAVVGADGVTTDPTYNVSLHQVINRNPDITRATGLTADGVTPWTANTCCYDNIPLAQSDLSAVRSVNAVDRTLGFRAWDALSIVQGWRSAPATNYGLALNSDATKGADRYRSFASTEHATTSQRPYLRITYALPVISGDVTAPVVALTAPSNNATVSGSSVTVSASAYDGVGVAGVQFKLDGVNVGNEDTSKPFTITWNSRSATNGAHTVTAVARDAAGNSATSASRTITVNNTVANRAPTLTQPANQTAAEGNLVSLALIGSDPDGNALTYSATGLPGGLTVNASTGLISGTLTYTTAGAYTVTAAASDGSLSQSRSFSWTVVNTNRAPVLAQPANQSSMISTSVSLALSGSDPDGTAVTYEAAGLPPGLTLSATSGVITGTLSANSAGVYAVSVTVADGSLTASRTFAWSVNTSDAPLEGDFDGDGRDDPATYRASTGEWRLWPSQNNFAAAAPIVWGGGSDVPVPADYDGDHKVDIAVYRPATGGWHVLLSSTNMQSSLDLVWGDSSDRPLPIDYDGDGRADLALPRFGGFEILLSGSNYSTSVTVR